MMEYLQKKMVVNISLLEVFSQRNMSKIGVLRLLRIIEVKV